MVCTLYRYLRRRFLPLHLAEYLALRLGTYIQVLQMTQDMEVVEVVEAASAMR